MSLRTVFHNDPFFAGADFPEQTAFEHRSRHDGRDRQISSQHRSNSQDIDTFQNPFTFMQTMMNNMGRMMTQMETRMNGNDFGNPGAHGVSFSSSTVMTYDNRNGGEPRVFQATSEKLRGPEGFDRTC